VVVSVYSTNHKHMQHISFRCAPTEFYFSFVKMRTLIEHSVIKTLFFTHQTKEAKT